MKSKQSEWKENERKIKAPGKSVIFYVSPLSKDRPRITQ